MSDKELIELINDLTLASLRCDLAKQNLDKAEKELEELSSRFNNEVENMNKEELLTDQEFAYKVELANKVFETLNIGEIGNNI